MEPQEEEDRLSAWIGREEVSEDELTPDLARRFAATFDDDPAAMRPGEPAPLGIHWCLCLPMVRTSGLLEDGIADTGSIMPPVSLPRRMRAGGGIRYHGTLRVGDKVTRRAYVKSIDFKQGKSGKLCFVRVVNEFTAQGKIVLEDSVDTVYREAHAGAPAERSGSPEPEPVRPEGALPIDFSAVLLFRYSALTFNAHRIHYDADYAREVEGYRGNVVHGPLQATLLLREAEAMLNAPPRQFDFVSRASILQGAPAWLTRKMKDGVCEIELLSENGRTAMKAAARLAGTEENGF